MKLRDNSSTVTVEDHFEDEVIGENDDLGRESPAFITVENEKGILEHVQIAKCGIYVIKSNVRYSVYPP